MSRPERDWACAGFRVAAGLVLGVAALVATAAEPQPYRYAAPIEIVKPAPFVELALPPAAYAHAAQPDLRDLRVVDAAGERVPFALLDPTPRGGARRAAARGDALSLAATAGGQRGVAVAGGGHGRRRPDHGASLRRRQR